MLKRYLIMFNVGALFFMPEEVATLADSVLEWERNKKRRLVVPLLTSTRPIQVPIPERMEPPLQAAGSRVHKRPTRR